MQHYDYIIIGSGFGGSVSAMRLSEKGYRVLLIEKGKRFEDQDYPKSDWQFWKFLWMPALKWFGFQKINFFRKVLILSGVGLGGGSNVYANTHMQPEKQFFTHPSWGHFKPWLKILPHFYDTARQMLGTTPVPELHREDQILQEVAADMGALDSFKRTEVGVYFGEQGEDVDPYFEGKGPKRQACKQCAGCMVGCRHGAKNTLSKNYLYFAEKAGVEILTLWKADKIEFLEGKYSVRCQSLKSGHKAIYTSGGLVVAGGVLGTLDLLFKQKIQYKTLPLLSDTLGSNVMTNSEMLCGITQIPEKVNHGVSISSVFNADPHTHVEIVKYNNESGLMGRLAVLAAGGGSIGLRLLKLLGAIISHPIDFLKSTFGFKNWGEKTIILLIMQSLEETLNMEWRKGRFKGLRFSREKGKRVEAFLPIGQEVMHKYQQKAGGIAQNGISEVFFNIPTTAHILGGCPMGEHAEQGVVDANFKVHGYPNFYVLDGSIIPTNPGVNPSLTITALSEYAMSQIPEKN
ncbi:GMC oxidoreductase [Persicobacter diffluens]|uniref:Cholesterol oxidase n=1 Tax=Persicobacter diffluens TaxID=981 RepID=A0AAN4W325_9BACT|nr:cholesterol oxidase [Persicobacter diffluens]